MAEGNTKGARTMTRLIDADACMAQMKNMSVEYDAETVQRCIEIVSNSPTIEAEPVKHGKWIGYAGTIGNECSVCGKWLDVLQGTAEMNYCPNCGADMRGEEEWTK